MKFSSLIEKKYSVNAAGLHEKTLAEDEPWERAMFDVRTACGS